MSRKRSFAGRAPLTVAAVNSCVRPLASRSFTSHARGLAHSRKQRQTMNQEQREALERAAVRRQKELEREDAAKAKREDAAQAVDDKTARLRTLRLAQEVT